MFTRIWALSGLVGICLSAAPVQAQVTREAGVGSVAGTLQKTIDDHDDYPFTSRGGQVLFADLDADLYINRQPGEHETGDAALTTSALADGEEEECGGEGMSRFALEVFDMGMNRICFATKPTRPGWDTDPRLACLLPDAGRYILRVGFAGMGGHEEAGAPSLQAATSPQVHPYLLNVSLRTLAESEPEEMLDEAIKGSVNRLPFKD